MKINLTETTIDEHEKDFNYKNYTLYDNTLGVSSDKGTIFDINSIKVLVINILKSEGVLFFITTNRYGRKSIDCKNTGLFIRLKRYLKQRITDELEHAYPGHNFHPYVELFLKNMGSKEGLVAQTSPFLIQSDPDYNNKVVKRVDMLNRFIDNIRGEAASPEFKAATEYFKSSQNDNCKSLLSYTDELFKRHSRLSVIRLDFHYKKDVDNCYLTEFEKNERYWQIKSDLGHLFKNMRSKPSLFKHILGYAWKLEHASETGFHYHMFFFFNEKKVHDDVNRAWKIGEYWANVITKGRGRFYSCNGKKSQYKFLGIGTIHRNDIKLRQGLIKAIKYVTKIENFNARMVALEESGRDFGTMQLK